MKCTSIYKSIDGPKLRRLYKALGCSKPEAIGVLYFLWDWGLDNADEDGILVGLEKDDISRYLYGVSSDCRLNMDDVVDALVATGWLDESEDGLCSMIGMTGRGRIIGPKSAGKRMQPERPKSEG